MLSKSLYFIHNNLYFVHNFDAAMHYSLYYSLLKTEDNDGIEVNDSVHRKKCNHKQGRWNFVLAGKDYSCRIYHALEIIRQSIFSAMESHKNSGTLALNTHGEYDTKISKQIFFKVIKPVLEEMFKHAGYKFKMFEGQKASEKIKQFLVNFKPDLDIFRIEWYVDKIFNDVISEPHVAEMELQFTA